MEVLKYLNNLLKVCSYREALDTLLEEYGVKTSSNEEYPDIICLNYCQIDSPKYHPITKECRSLVLSIPSDSEDCFRVVSRSFDRFYNLNEDPNQGDVDINSLLAYEKIDGSLVSLFNYKGEWLYRTRSMIMPNRDLKINGTDLSWKELIEECLGNIYDYNLLERLTYIFEIVSPENRMVTRYDERKAYLISVRNNNSGDHSFHFWPDHIESLRERNIGVPKIYKFNTLEDCLKASKELKQLNEGYVLYDEYNSPCVKVKSPAYVAAHRLRGENLLTGKRIMDLIFIEEYPEYLSIFPEDSYRFTKYLEAYEKIFTTFEQDWSKFGYIEDQKEFSLKIKESKVKHLLFRKRQNPKKSFNEIFNEFFLKFRYEMMERFCNEY